ncbi:4-alpha-glucanotransferase [Dyella monticola]|uniref:4-alpha-glucanotransferase n=1 Tax=Dyella monticola TaxID=1927958 RepID=A0A370WU11_9GAMM|nr:4-alpha-glucanotransferase [Dyella monticola]RDS79497.1 4-alpha-glucanotransferase [Dyella monticola]
MSDSSLDRLAHAAGIALHWTDAFGQHKNVPEDVLHGLLHAMRLPSHDVACRQGALEQLQERENTLPALITADTGEMFTLPFSLREARTAVLEDESGTTHALAFTGEGVCQAPIRHGYYTLTCGDTRLTLAVAPKRCFGVGDSLGSEKRRAWGLGAQVYAVRHPDDGGLGDSRGVAELADAVGHAGGDALALSPLHAMSPIARHYSPYSPSDRGFLNWLHADPAQVFGESVLHAAIHRSGATSAWQQAQANDLVEWPATYALRRKVLRVLHEHFTHAPQHLRNDFQRFVAHGGDALKQHAWVAARQSLAARNDESTSWTRWEHDWHQTSTATQFAQEHVADADFEMFLQWLAARCWDATSRSACDAGQRIGLIWDIAVGFEHGGSEAWRWRDGVLEGLELGAPPDAFNPTGQSWGITSYSPWGLKASGFRPFIELLRANMARGGGIRIDHIIGFRRLWVLPHGQSSTQGAYIELPLMDLLRLTALESWRHRCIVIGEDLGTVPEGLRNVLAARGVLGIDVLLFTRDEKGDFLPAPQWRANAVATTTTHDLPPLAGWREGTDLTQLAKAQAWDEQTLLERMQARRNDVVQLDRALSASQASPGARSPVDTLSPALPYLAKTPSPLILIPLEDALHRNEQPNLPGTVDTYPNWRHRLPENIVQTLQPVMKSIDTAMKEAAPA